MKFLAEFGLFHVKNVDSFVHMILTDKEPLCIAFKSEAEVKSFLYVYEKGLLANLDKICGFRFYNADLAKKYIYDRDDFSAFWKSGGGTFPVFVDATSLTACRFLLESDVFSIYLIGLIGHENTVFRLIEEFGSILRGNQHGLCPLSWIFQYARADVFPYVKCFLKDYVRHPDGSVKLCSWRYFCRKFARLDSGLRYLLHSRSIAGETNKRQKATIGEFFYKDLGIWLQHKNFIVGE